MKISRIGKVVLGLLIAAFGLYIFLKDVEIDRLVSELQATRVHALLLVSILAILTIYLRSVRWRFILPDLPDTTKKNLFNNVAIGFMLNNILPARLGEVARVFILWRKNRFPVAVCVGTLILERIIDLCMFFIFFFIPIFILPQCSDLLPFGFITAGITLCTILFFVFYRLFQNQTVALGKWLAGKAPLRFQTKIKKIGWELASNIGWLSSLKRTGLVILFSFLTTLCYPLMIIILAGNSTMPFGLLEGMFAQAFAAFGAAIPLAPGYVGTIHAVMLQGLSILGMDDDQGRALVILYHILNYIPVTILGLILFFRTNLSFREIAEAKDIIDREE